MEFFKKLLNSFRYAANGIVFCINHETNIRIHIVATICVLFLSAFAAGRLCVDEGLFTVADGLESLTAGF